MFTHTYFSIGTDRNVRFHRKKYVKKKKLKLKCLLLSWNFFAEPKQSSCYNSRPISNRSIDQKLRVDSAGIRLDSHCLLLNVIGKNYSKL